jgi:hypothetical protein
MILTMTIEFWDHWLNENRLDRWNHVRFLAGEESLTKQQGLAHIKNLQTSDMNALLALKMYL